MKKVLVPLLAASAALAGVLTSGESASATVVTVGPYSSSYGPSVTNYSVPAALSVPQVNPLTVDDDAVLSQVMQNLKGTLSGSVTVINQTTLNQSLSRLGVVGQIDAIGQNTTLTTSLSVNFVTSRDVYLPGETSIYQLNAMATAMQTLTAPPAGTDNLSAWIGNGNVTKSVIAQAFQNFVGSSNLRLIFNTLAKADLDVTYKVHDPQTCPGDPGCPPIPTDTPEPGSLLGLGLLGLGGLSRKVAFRRKEANLEFN